MKNSLNLSERFRKLLEFQRKLKMGKAPLALQEWVLKNVSLGGKPFSFGGHEYLENIYKDGHPRIVIEKASQMGVSVYALVRAIWACENFSLKTLYYMPTDGDAKRFSKDRFNGLANESDHISSLLAAGGDNSGTIQGKIKKQLDSVELKDVAGGKLYFLGLHYSGQNRRGRSGGKTKSIDADFLIFDEVDEGQPAQMEAAMHRIDHSGFKWILKLSTPTFPDYGINRDFQKSDQRFWLLKCSCGSWECLEETFPRCIRQEKDLVFLVCSKCGSKLNPARGEWVAKYPDRTYFRGYHITQLFSTYVDLYRIWQDYQDPKTRMQFFYNHTLGIPYVDKTDMLCREEVTSLCRFDPGAKGDRRSMGVDQGSTLHYIISETSETGYQRIIDLGTVTDFHELDLLMAQYDVQTCVIDALPNQHSAREFMERNSGRVYLCYYEESVKKVIQWRDSTNSIPEARVETNRTYSLDHVLRIIKEKRIFLPPLSEMVETLALHLSNIIKVEETDEETGIAKQKYIKKGEDHFAHALNYCLIASEKSIAKPVFTGMALPKPKKGSNYSWL